jgi:hypothetical protein
LIFYPTNIIIIFASEKPVALARPADFGFVVFPALALFAFMLVLLSMAVLGTFLPWISKIKRADAR